MKISTWKTAACILALIGLVCCAQKEKHGDQQMIAELESVPEEVTETIANEFPGAMPYRIAIDTLLRHLAPYGIGANQILWGQSTCVDDITNTKDKMIHPEIKGPFTFGGLGGLPFTGVTGMDAFAHHVPKDGTALLFVGPHIGYHTGEGWGKILRHGQEHTSTCCGALYAALSKLQKNEIQKGSPSEDDYQEEVLEQLALQHEDEITTAKEPLLALTRVVEHEAERKMTDYAHKVKERHFAYAVIVVGVIINTDYQFDDYLWIDHIYIKDISKNTWIEGSVK